MISNLKLSALSLLLGSTLTSGYTLKEAGGIELSDGRNGISELKTIFTGVETDVSVTGLSWGESDSSEESISLVWQTFVDGTLQKEGTEVLEGSSFELPTSLEAGSVVVEKAGKSSISVKLSLANSTKESISAEGEYQAYASGVSIFPILIIIALALATGMVELSMFSGIFVGACIIKGNVEDAFKTMLDTYITDALADGGHAQVILFSLFLSGLVGMIQKSGGMAGATNLISKFATTPMLGQLACFSIGILIFFDDYANLLLAGESMKPLLDLLSVSREKLSFIIDATAAPVASLSPISSWVGYEAGLIEDELKRISEKHDDMTISTSGFAVFLESIQYRYYPIFMLCFMVISIVLQREFGPMLVAERKVRAYGRTDGGDGTSSKLGKMEKSKNSPSPDTPPFALNMFAPIILLIFFVFYLLVLSGTDSSDPDQTFMDKIESSDSYVALLYGTMATALVTLIFYHIQVVKNGVLVLIPDSQTLRELFSFNNSNENAEEGTANDESSARFLMNVKTSIDSFLVGMAHIFPAIIVLTLAWSSGTVMKEVGTDRLFATIINDSVAPGWLPTLSFFVSFLLALATGTSWGTMAIVFPLMMVPTYNKSDGDVEIMYSTVAGILSGSVAGDHASPISDTTVLASLAAECDLIAHVKTQAPYTAFIAIVSIFLGTIPIGFSAWPNTVSILLGLVAIIVFTFFFGQPVISATGKFDLIQELLQGIFKRKDMDELKGAVIEAYNNNGGNTKENVEEEAKEAAPDVENRKVIEDNDDEASMDA